MTERAGGIVLFDGICNLCNGAVRWIVKRDKKGRFRFAALQSQMGQQELKRREAAAVLTGNANTEVQEALQRALPPRVTSPSGNMDGPPPKSIVLLDNKGAHSRSTAALRIALGLDFPWYFLATGLLLPKVMRDPVYNLIARNRYRWFGKRETCMVPSPELAARFLEEVEPTTRAT